MKDLTRDEMAYVYAGLIAGGEFPFAELNTRIMNRWSRSGLVYIKNKAWKILDQLHEVVDDVVLKGASQ